MSAYMLEGPWVAVAPLIAMVVVLLWPRVGRAKLSIARAKLRNASVRAARLRARQAAQARAAALKWQQEQARQAHDAMRRLEALRTANQAAWTNIAPTLRAALDVVNILLAQHGSLSLESGPAGHGRGAEFGITCAIIAHDEAHGRVGSLILQVDDGFLACILVWPGHRGGSAKASAAGMSVADATSLITETLQPVVSAGSEQFGFGPALSQGFEQRGYA